MPIRTVLPLTSCTCRMMSSPMTMRSPTRRVMLSTGPPWIRCLRTGGRLVVRLAALRGGLGPPEQRGAHVGVGRLVDDLVGLGTRGTRRDDDRCAEVRGEVLDALGRTDGHPDVGGRVPAQAARRSLLVGEDDLVAGEKLPRPRDRQG